MNFQYFSHTHPGMVRKNNEDAITTDAEAGLAVLADGMGGYKAGEIASAMATSMLREQFGQWLHEVADQASAQAIEQAMRHGVEAANRAIFRAAHKNTHYQGMGTTLVVAAFRAGSVVVGHIGDSRAYRWRAGTLEQITRDHSLMQEQLDAGLITAEQARQSSQKNLVTRAMGVEPDVELEVHQHAVENGDIYLLCSDGLSDMLTDAAIGDCLGAGLQLSDTGYALVQAANAAGGRDNVSLIMVRAGEEEARRGLLSRWLSR